MNYPQKLKGPGLQPEALDKHPQINLDYPTALPSSKALLKAHLAQAGYLVHYAADGYLVVRADWGLSRHCDSLADLQAFARKVGVTA